jgi:stage II sporulation protein D
MNIEPQFWVRVLLLDDVKSCRLKFDSPFCIIDSQTQNVCARLDKFDVATKIEIFNARITIANYVITDNETVVLPEAPYIFNLNGNDYRGKLQFIINPDGHSFDVINLVPIEPYLAGVVGAEMYSYWEPEALKAQAIAARTYCLYIKKRFGSRRHWDVSKTQANQVYRGVKAESPQIWNAVNRTQGRVLVCRQTGGAEDIFPAYYSSSCGGHTENSKHVFGDSFEPLVGVVCPYCKNVAKPSFFFWPMAQFDKTDVTARLLQRYPKLKRLGEIKSITPARQSNYGNFARLTLIKLLGSTGKSDSIRAEDLRLTIDPTGLKLKSTICKILNMGNQWAFLLGRGYGHGVGMCQCGAEGMARQGKKAGQILSYYYPGSRIVKVY